MADTPDLLTPGATKAGKGKYAFKMADLKQLDLGPDYATTRGFVVEGERMMVGLGRIPKGTVSEPHWHPNEQWIYVLEGRSEMVIEGEKIVGTPGMVIYVPAKAVHEARSTGDTDLVFFTCKDRSHGIAGIKA
ncbi:MAG: cupin domain-containing protein [Variibacter sp.]|nr:cupin domain-containing protein [Variibacter sp.]